MTLTVSTDEGKVAVQGELVGHALSWDETASADTPAQRHRSRAEVGLEALHQNWTRELPSTSTSVEVGLREYAAGPDDLLAWGRSLRRGPGDKVDADL